MDEYPVDRYTIAPTGEFLEWRRNYDAALAYDTAPDDMFERDGRIFERTAVAPSQSVQVNRRPIVEGYDWNEVAAQEHGLHSLQAVVNTRGHNYAVATAVVDERQVTYITSMGEEAQSASLIGVISNEAADGTQFTVYDTNSEVPEAMFTVTRTPEGSLTVTNESVEPLHVGAGREIDPPRRSFRERFSFSSIFSGLKKAVRAEQETRYQNRNILSGKMGWMTPANTVASHVRWMRHNNYNWVATNPLETRG